MTCYTIVPVQRRTKRTQLYKGTYLHTHTNARQIGINRLQGNSTGSKRRLARILTN
jgi:hypothetical protein